MAALSSNEKYLESREGTLCGTSEANSSILSSCSILPKTEHDSNASPFHQTSSCNNEETFPAPVSSTAAPSSNSYARGWLLPQENFFRRTHLFKELQYCETDFNNFVAETRTSNTIAKQTDAHDGAFPLSGTVAETKIDTNPSREASPMYRPLIVATSCRVLHIMPGNKSDPIQCSLSVIDLSGIHCSYVALSYVWGNRDPPLEIRCNGNSFLVTRNLRDGLERIRDRYRTRTVWVDALCINQSDDIERGNQVKLMKRIYSNAAQVLIWLGHDRSNHASCVFSALRDIAEAASCHAANQIIDNMVGMSVQWESVKVFYQLEYFQRIWIIQEVTEAASALLMWGQDETGWDIVGPGTSFIRNNRYAYQSLSEDEIKGLVHVYMMYRLPYQDFQPITFFDLLRMTSQFLATDDRDKIFGILGLPNQDSDPIHGKPFIEPDYTLSRNELYEKVAVKILRKASMPFDLLSSVDHGDDLCQDFPSWIPQWHTNHSIDLVSHRQDAQHLPSGGYWSGNIDSVLQDWEINRAISAFGFEYDTIVSSTAALKTRGKDDAWYFGTIASWLEQIQAVSNNVQLAWQDIAWTLLTGRNWYGEPIPSLADLGHVWGAKGPKDSALAVAWAYCHNRRLFVTRKGVLGLGPAALRLGDRVCVLFGARIPYVLRLEDSKYKLAGACYVHSIMHGQLFSEWLQKERSISNFLIQ